MSKTVHSTVAFQTPFTTVVANGKLVLDLSQNATITSSGGQVAPKRVSITLDSTGNAPNTIMLANDELTPSGTTYLASLYDSSGNFLGILGKWSIVGASPIDLSQIVATTTGASYPGVVLLNPAGVQKILSFNLELAKALVLDGSSSGAITLQAIAAAGSNTATLPANTGTIAELNLAQTWSAVQTFNSGNAKLAGSSSGSVIIQPVAAAGSNTATLPANTGTIAELNLAQTWTAAQTFSSGILGPGLQKQIFTGNGTFTIPTGITAVKVTVTGGGGAGGGGTSAPSPGGGGGAGGTAIKWLSGLTPGNTIAVTVGAGGTGVAGANNGNNGNNSTIASGTQSITTVTGGLGNGGLYGAGSAFAAGGTGGTATNGDLNFGGGAGSFTYLSGAGGVGGNSVWGGGGAVTGTSVAGSNGAAAGAGGGGAGGNGGNLAGGNGANGVVIFEWLN